MKYQSMTAVLFVALLVQQSWVLGQNTALNQVSQTTKPAATPVASNTEISPSKKWETAIIEFEKADRQAPPPEGCVLFIGSSTIRLWKSLKQDFPEHQVINRGFGGSQIADSVFFADRIVVPYKPKQIVFYAGSNDLAAGKSPEQVAEDFKEFVRRVHRQLPDTRISFMCIGPSPARWSRVEKQKRANLLIRDYIKAGKNLDYIDVWDQFLGTDGKPRDEYFVADKLHNSDAGYRIRTQAVRPFLLGPLHETMSLIRQRLELMPLVAQAKWNRQLPVTDAKREASLLDALKAKGQLHGVSPDLIHEFFTAQMTAAKLIQDRNFAQWTDQKQMRFSDAPSLEDDLRPKIDKLNELLLASLKSVSTIKRTSNWNADVEQARRSIFESSLLSNDIVTVAVQPLNSTK